MITSRVEYEIERFILELSYKYGDIKKNDVVIHTFGKLKAYDQRLIYYDRPCDKDLVKRGFMIQKSCNKEEQKKMLDLLREMYFEYLKDTNQL